MNSTHANFEKLNCILPIDFIKDGYDGKILNKRIAVVIHLHYLDTFDQYKKYIDNIPQEIALYFTCSNDELSKKIEDLAIHRENCRLIQKNNRGRDISSFLVACRKEILKYDFFCFLHDKKEKNPSMKSDTDKWIYSQWENMLGSKAYIYNVLTYLDKNKQVGLLLPPIPFTERISFVYRDNWYSNYENTVELAKNLNLSCAIPRENSPMALGTVYWARVDALRKLLEYDWKYDDFDAEPLADDGTISHAIERVLEYVAKDAGYESKWVMTDHYAEERLGYFTAALSKAFKRLHKSVGIRNIPDLDQFDEKAFELKERCKNYNRIFIYGAGLFGLDCLRFLINIGLNAEAFIVTDMTGNKPVIEGIPVYPINKIEFNNEIFVIVAVKKEYQEKIFEVLKEKRLPMSAVYNWDSH